MIAAILVALIVVTNEGKTSVVENLSNHACAEALCILTDSLSCEDRDARDARRLKWQREADETWAKAHPKEVAACEARQRRALVNNHSTAVKLICRAQPPRAESGGWFFEDQTAPKIARCVK